MRTRILRFYFFFFLNDTAPTEFYPLSLPDALPIPPAAFAVASWHYAPPDTGAWRDYSANESRRTPGRDAAAPSRADEVGEHRRGGGVEPDHVEDRKSTRLNSSHLVISYAVFCLKKK